MASGKASLSRLIGALALGLVLSACAGQPQLQPAPARALPPVPPRPAPSGPVVPVPANMTVPPIPQGGMISSPPIAPPPPPPTDALSLRARYGAPDFVRQESDSELWRYDGQKCAVFFFLYREGDAFKLRYSETLPRGMMMAADPACVESLSGRAGSVP